MKMLWDNAVNVDEHQLIRHSCIRLIFLKLHNNNNINRDFVTRQNHFQKISNLDY